MHYVVMDLEWNQAMSSKSSVFNKLPIHLRGEIIEIGAVKLNEDMTPGEEFQIDVKPMYFKRMHYKVKKLTGFDRERLAAGVSFRLIQLRQIAGRQSRDLAAHHPLLFRPLRSLTGRTQVERCVAMAVQKGIAVYAAHTNLDNAPGGVNFKIAEKLGLADVRFLSPLRSGEGGSGVVGKLPRPLRREAFLELVARTFGVEALRHNGAAPLTVQTVALCGGAGEFLLDEAIRRGADAFLTGEMGYHRYFGHEEEILIGVLGHYESEQFTVQLLQEVLERACPGLRTVQTELCTNPILIH